MTKLVHRAAALEIHCGGPFHIAGDESLDLSSMLVDDDRVSEVDPARFVRLLGPDQRRLLSAKAESADSLGAWHDFMTLNKVLAKSAAPPDALHILSTPAVIAAYARYREGDAAGALHLALPRRDTVGSKAIIPATHFVGAMRVAWAQVHGRCPFPLRGTDARLNAGRLELRAAIVGRLRTDAPRPMPTSRKSEWLVAAYPEDGARFAGSVGPGNPRQGAPWGDALANVGLACQSFYRPRLAEQLDALRGDAERAPQSPLMRFVNWGDAALRDSGEMASVFPLQVGSHTGSAVHPGCGLAGSAHRVPVCMEWTGPSPVNVVAGSQPLGWLLVRLGPAGA